MNYDELRQKSQRATLTVTVRPEELRALLDENEALRAALTIDREEVGRIMHDSWRRTKESQGFHRPPPRERPCDWCHTDMVPWNELPEHQKDINRHAFDDVLSEIQRRAALGDAS